MTCSGGAIRAGAVLLVVLAVLPGCAKKLLPPSPDRFAPQLQEVVTRNRVRLELAFDEDIDAQRLAADSFRVTGPDGDRLGLRGAGRGRSGDRVELWTLPQEDQVYELTGVVWDRAGNPGRLRARFRGSVRADTIPPRVRSVVPEPGSEGQRRVAVRVSFTEPVDTTGELSWMVIPSRYDTLFARAWQEDWQEVEFAMRDTLANGEVLYFLLQPGVRDLEGNRNRDPAFTYFTQDSLLEGDVVYGRATWQEGMLGTGTVLFHGPGAERMTSAVAPVLSDGSFSVRVAPGGYEIQAVVDTNLDGLTDLASPLTGFNTEAESIEVRLLPESLPRSIDGYRR